MNSKKDQSEIERIAAFIIVGLMLIVAGVFSIIKFVVPNNILAGLIYAGIGVTVIVMAIIKYYGRKKSQK